MAMDNSIPKTQTAVQLTAADELELNTQKAVDEPGPYQILCRVEMVGLCFSDLKLLKQFAGHVRKGEVVSGVDEQALKEIPSYVPGSLPAVPGHEAVVRVCAVGDKVRGIEPGGRYLVQTDYRWIATENSNAAFGYNFEGALQEYVLMDQRVITSPDGDSMLIPASEELSASAVGLVEPWACVEDAYAVVERSSLVEGGRMLVVADAGFDGNIFTAFLGRFGRPSKITCCMQKGTLGELDIPVEEAGSVAELGDAEFDDVIYFGSDAETAGALFGKMAAKGLLNIVLCGGEFDGDVTAGVGRIHYGGIRLIGTAGSDPAESMECIPRTGEIRAGDKINVVGAAGPMGVMHVIRNICEGVEGVTVFAGDPDADRLSALSRIAEPLACRAGVTYVPYSPGGAMPDAAFDYTAIMAPIPALVAEAIKTSADRGIINIFAGIPMTVNAGIDLNSYIRNRLYFIGTSGSTLDDMKTVLGKVENRTLDTNLSVAAVGGLKVAVEGIKAVENRLIAGKIIIYPACMDLPLTKLEDLKDRLPKVAECLDDGLWTKEAEDALLSEAGS